MKKCLQSKKKKKKWFKDQKWVFISVLDKSLILLLRISGFDGEIKVT